MELRQLEHFVAVAQHRNFTRAAREAHVVQSTLSASIHRLEREIGALLFERTTRRVALTPAGWALLPTAQRMLDDAEQARVAVAAVTGMRGGQIALGTIQALTWVNLPAALGRFHRDHPGVHITVQEAPVDELVEALFEGHLDLAYIARDQHRLPEGMAVLATHDEELALALAPTHPLATRPHVRLAELGEESFVDFQAGPGLQTAVERYCAQAQLHRNITVRTTQLQLLIDLVAEGLGMAIIPAPLARHAGLACLPITAPQPHRALALVSREHHPSNPAALALLHQLHA